MNFLLKKSYLGAVLGEHSFYIKGQVGAGSQSVGKSKNSPA